MANQDTFEKPYKSSPWRKPKNIMSKLWQNLCLQCNCFIQAYGTNSWKDKIWMWHLWEDICKGNSFKIPLRKKSWQLETLSQKKPEINVKLSDETIRSYESDVTFVKKIILIYEQKEIHDRMKNIYCWFVLK